MLLPLMRIVWFTFCNLYVAVLVYLPIGCSGVRSLLGSVRPTMASVPLVCVRPCLIAVSVPTSAFEFGQPSLRIDNG